MRILSFGAGVNSTAILCLHIQGKVDLDCVVFADTGGEHPETYEYIEKTIKPFCQSRDIPFHIVKRGDLYREYYGKNIIPFCAFRSCTDKFKIRPIKKFAKTQFGDNVTFILGIDHGEKHRADRYRGVTFEFPLIDLEIDREGCKRIIEETGLPIPIKSGCFYCPFTKRSEWLKLLENHRDLFLKAEKFEKNGRKYPKYSLTKVPLQRLRESIELQKGLYEWIDEENEPCVFCHS